MENQNKPLLIRPSRTPKRMTHLQCYQFFKRAQFYKKTGEKRALFKQKNGQKTGEIKKCHEKKRALSGFFYTHCRNSSRLF